MKDAIIVMSRGALLLALPLLAFEAYSAEPTAKLEDVPAQLHLSCDIGPSDGPDSARCLVSLVNPQKASHIYIVPNTPLPFRIPTWPEVTLELDVRRVGDRRPVPNVYMEYGTVDMTAFSKDMLSVLRTGNSVGWEIRLRNGWFWRYNLSPGKYEVRAKLTVHLMTAAGAPSVVDFEREVKAPYSPLTRLDGVFESNTVVVTVR